MLLNYASIASALSAQTEPQTQYHPNQPRQFYQKPNPVNNPRSNNYPRFTNNPRPNNYPRFANNSKSNIVCYRCSEYGHIARDCMAERLPTKEQRYQMNAKPQTNRKINYAAVEDEEYYSDEDEVYITRTPRPKPYSTN